MEHHSNIVPWQMLCERTGAVLVIPMNQEGELIMADKLLSEKTKIVATIHISNALGTINPST
jgi:cysteine desulfurase/selenocysteine lyase